jgi:hypothetical protein
MGVWIHGEDGGERWGKSRAKVVQAVDRRDGPVSKRFSRTRSRFLQYPACGSEDSYCSTLHR